jgi:hypothetical protein
MVDAVLSPRSGAALTCGRPQAAPALDRARRGTHLGVSEGRHRVSAVVPTRAEREHRWEMDRVVTSVGTAARARVGIRAGRRPADDAERAVSRHPRPSGWADRSARMPVRQRGWRARRGAMLSGVG